EQRLHPLVANESLRQLGGSLHHVDKIEYDPALGAHDQIEVAQAHIEIDNDNLLPAPRQRRAERGSRRRLADASLAGRHNHHLPHRRPPWFQPIATTRIALPASHSCTGRPRSPGSMSSAAVYSPSMPTTSASVV